MYQSHVDKDVNVEDNRIRTHIPFEERVDLAEDHRYIGTADVLASHIKSLIYDEWYFGPMLMTEEGSIKPLVKEAVEAVVKFKALSEVAEKIAIYQWHRQKKRGIPAFSRTNPMHTTEKFLRLALSYFSGRGVPFWIYPINWSIKQSADGLKIKCGAIDESPRNGAVTITAPPATPITTNVTTTTSSSTATTLPIPPATSVSAATASASRRFFNKNLTIAQGTPQSLSGSVSNRATPRLDAIMNSQAKAKSATPSAPSMPLAYGGDSSSTNANKGNQLTTSTLHNTVWNNASAPLSGANTTPVGPVYYNSTQSSSSVANLGDPPLDATSSEILNLTLKPLRVESDRDQVSLNRAETRNAQSQTEANYMSRSQWADWFRETFEQRIELQSEIGSLQQKFAGPISQDPFATQEGDRDLVPPGPKVGNFQFGNRVVEFADPADYETLAKQMQAVFAPPALMTHIRPNGVEELRQVLLMPRDTAPNRLILVSWNLMLRYQVSYDWLTTFATSTPSKWLQENVVLKARFSESDSVNE